MADQDKTTFIDLSPPLMLLTSLRMDTSHLFGSMYLFSLSEMRV